MEQKVWVLIAREMTDIANEVIEGASVVGVYANERLAYGAMYEQEAFKVGWRKTGDYDVESYEVEE